MRIAEGGVKYCSSCFGQYLDRDHIDFESFYDGPTFKQDNGDYHYIGDLVICSACLENAGKLIGMVKDDQIKQENVELGEALESKNEELKGLVKYIHDLERAIDSKPNVAKPPKQPSLVAAAGILANGG